MKNSRAAFCVGVLTAVADAVIVLMGVASMIKNWSAAAQCSDSNLNVFMVFMATVSLALAVCGPCFYVFTFFAYMFASSTFGVWALALAGLYSGSSCTSELMYGVTVAYGVNVLTTRSIMLAVVLWERREQRSSPLAKEMELPPATAVV